MSKLTKFILALVLVVLVAGGVFLVTWEIPPPTTQMEKTLPDGQFQQ